MKIIAVEGIETTEFARNIAQYLESKGYITIFYDNVMNLILSNSFENDIIAPFLQIEGSLQGIEIGDIKKIPDYIVIDRWRESMKVFAEKWVYDKYNSEIWKVWREYYLNQISSLYWKMRTPYYNIFYGSYYKEYYANLSKLIGEAKYDYRRNYGNSPIKIGDEIIRRQREETKDE